MSYPDLSQRRLDSITPEEANKIYTCFMEHYKARLVHASPHDTMVHWPSELAFSENFYPHPAEDGYASRMGVGMAIDVGGPACRVLYQPAAAGDLVKPTHHYKVSLYSRMRNSTPALDASWAWASRSQQEPHFKFGVWQTPFFLPTRVVLPRDIPLTPDTVAHRRTIRTGHYFTPADPSLPHIVTSLSPQVAEPWTEEWTILKVRQTDFWKGRVAEDDRKDGGPSNPDVTFLRLDLGPSSNGIRHEDDKFSILFRVRVVFYKEQWVPWAPGLLGWPEPEIKDEWDVGRQEVIRGQPFEPHAEVHRFPALTFRVTKVVAATDALDPIRQTRHALSHRQRRNYGQTHAGGGSCSSW